MTNELIATALETASDTKDIEFGVGVLKETGPLFARLFPGKTALVVADENTFGAAGKGVVDSLKAAGGAGHPPPQPARDRAIAAVSSSAKGFLFSFINSSPFLL